ncbi:DUF3662 domain-containing protein [Streptomyces sp. SID5785]|uniref:FhaA domain-containing protein n=1 Tax=Streptomyces sp. SID5785 TaxID=2690309 RepID=UPI001361861D|nr:FhaA domain-containing protein [Streptomyces sp. SID5785]MZD05933.1 DUF3662 domain-containing protein [Streptomyces sp. SID5785]
MRLLRDVEALMERWSNPLWARVLPAPHREAEVIRALRRHCDEKALIVTRGRTVVPNVFAVVLPRQAHRQLLPYQAQVQRHLAVQVRRHAAENAYTFVGAVEVSLRAAGAARAPRFTVQSRIAPYRRPPSSPTRRTQGRVRM